MTFLGKEILPHLGLVVVWSVGCVCLRDRCPCNAFACFGHFFRHAHTSWSLYSAFLFPQPLQYVPKPNWSCILHGYILPLFCNWDRRRWDLAIAVFFSPGNKWYHFYRVYKWVHTLWNISVQSLWRNCSQHHSYSSFTWLLKILLENCERVCNSSS